MAGDNDGAQAGNRQLEWYRDGTKWLVAMSGGAIVLGLGWALDGKFDASGKVLFSLAGVLLLAASGCGILSVFKFSDYESSRHEPGEDAVEGMNLDRRAANGWFKKAWAAFFGGLLVLAACAFWLIWIGDPPGKKGDQFMVYGVDATPGAIAVLVDSKQKKTFSIHRDPQTQALSLKEIK